MALGTAMQRSLKEYHGMAVLLSLYASGHTSGL